MSSEVSMEYRHTQYARLGWWLIAAALVAAGLAVEALFDGPVLLAAAAIAVVAGPFIAALSRLTVDVDESSLRAWYGWGWPRKTLHLSAAQSARAVRNRWWYGFGIFWMPHGTVWNVWGLEAIEIGLASGRVLRVGTDEPEALLAALQGRVPVSQAASDEGQPPT
ncbi:MAG: hypothetical protein OEM94_00950 [Acidimicrobiia bacterium]|nr:hypothetical protein [Acidimicrobiia bacterium]